MTIKQKITKTISLIFGQISWKCPPWLCFLNNKSKGLFSRKSIFGAGALIVVAAGLGYYWVINQRVVNTVSSAYLENIYPVEQLKKTDNIPPVKPLTLTVNFSGVYGRGPSQAAPLDQVDQPIKRGVSMTPSMPGKWLWDGSNTINFLPAKHWPAGMNYQIKFDKKLLSKQTLMKQYTLSFHTQKMTSSLRDFRFYLDPTNPEQRYLVATIYFNYPVDKASLKKHLELYFQKTTTQTAMVQNAGEAIPYTVSLGPYKRYAYIHSKAITLNKIDRFAELSLSKGIKPVDGYPSQMQVSRTVKIPSLGDFLKVTSANALIVSDKDNIPHKTLVINTTVGVTQQQFNQNVKVYLLPYHKKTTSPIYIVSNLPFVWLINWFNALGRTLAIL